MHFSIELGNQGIDWTNLIATIIASITGLTGIIAIWLTHKERVSEFRKIVYDRQITELYSTIDYHVELHELIFELYNQIQKKNELYHPESANFVQNAKSNLFNCIKKGLPHLTRMHFFLSSNHIAVIININTLCNTYIRRLLKDTSKDDEIKILNAFMSKYLSERQTLIGIIRNELHINTISNELYERFGNALKSPIELKAYLLEDEFQIAQHSQKLTQ